MERTSDIRDVAAGSVNVDSASGGSAIDITRALGLPGWMHPLELAWLARQARGASTIIEVGCWQGRSTRVLADNSSGVVYAIDRWNAPYEGYPIDAAVYDAFAAHLADHLATGRVVPIRDDSRAALPRLAGEIGAVADLVFIDADHLYAAVQRDIVSGLQLVRPGGVIAGHDLTHRDWPGVKRAVEAVFGDSYNRGPESIWWVRA